MRSGMLACFRMRRVALAVGHGGLTLVSIRVAWWLGWKEHHAEGDFAGGPGLCGVGSAVAWQEGGGPCG